MSVLDDQNDKKSELFHNDLVSNRGFDIDSATKIQFNGPKFYKEIESINKDHFNLSKIFRPPSLNKHTFKTFILHFDVKFSFVNIPSRSRKIN